MHEFRGGWGVSEFQYFANCGRIFFLFALFNGKKEKPIWKIIVMISLLKLLVTIPIMTSWAETFTFVQFLTRLSFSLWRKFLAAATVSASQTNQSEKHTCLPTSVLCSLCLPERDFPESTPPTPPLHQHLALLLSRSAISYLCWGNLSGRGSRAAVVPRRPRLQKFTFCS